MNEYIVRIEKDNEVTTVCELVRCQECRYVTTKKNGKLHCRWWYRAVNGDDYCGRGEQVYIDDTESQNIA